MIIHSIDCAESGLHRYTWFWSDRGENFRERFVRARWRGALSVYWRAPAIVTCDWRISFYANAIDSDQWTGRTRSLHWRHGWLAIYLRTPAGWRWKFERSI